MGVEAILIKVAGAGLLEKHLGKTLAEMQPTLLRLVKTLRAPMFDIRALTSTFPCPAKFS